MASQTQMRRPSSETTRARDTDTVVEAKADTAAAEELTSTIDDLLDEIDGILEENAEAIVAAYRQRGGQ